jgi:hypothetical protein
MRESSLLATGPLKSFGTGVESTFRRPEIAFRPLKEARLGRRRKGRRAPLQTLRGCTGSFILRVSLDFSIFKYRTPTGNGFFSSS